MTDVNWTVFFDGRSVTFEGTCGYGLGDKDRAAGNQTCGFAPICSLGGASGVSFKPSFCHYL